MPLHTCGTDITDSVLGQNILFIGQNIFVYCWYNLVVVSYQSVLAGWTGQRSGKKHSLEMKSAGCWSSTKIGLHFESFEKLVCLLV